MSITELSKQDVEDLALGATVLGTGGGGDPYIGKLMALQALERGRKIELVPPEDVEDDAFVVAVAGMGAPVVMIEKLPSGKEAAESLKSLEKYFGRKADYIICIEAGGMNSTIPLATAAELGRPVIDGDGMGRAFPELQMVTFHLYGVSATPMSMADEKGNSVILDTIDNFWAERVARAITVKFGGVAWISIYPMSGKQFKQAAVRNSLTKEIMIGRELRDAKKSGRNPLDALLDATKGFLLFKGKIVDVVRRATGGFARGEATIEGLDEFRGSKLVVKFQNENLIAIKDGEVLASVPDLITIVEKDSAKPITTERLKYGLRVAVLGIPCDPKWRTGEALKVVGPKYFGYDVEYTPVEIAARRSG
ncbi:MAG: DUF917 domain-containing protein [Desulfurococcales archaeon]|nr:DUF917 domain-containing protein [Desulfurococcales archaeon]